MLFIKGTWSSQWLQRTNLLLLTRIGLKMLFTSSVTNSVRPTSADNSMRYSAPLRRSVLEISQCTNVLIFNFQSIWSLNFLSYRNKEKDVWGLRTRFCLFIVPGISHQYTQLCHRPFIKCLLTGVQGLFRTDKTSYDAHVCPDKMF